MAFTVRDAGSLVGFSGYALAVYPVALLPDTLKPTDTGAIRIRRRGRGGAGHGWRLQCRHRRSALYGKASRQLLS